MFLQDSIVALVTPFLKDLSIDEEAYGNLIRLHLKSRTKAMVIAGTTGESATLTNDEKLQLLKIALKLKQELNFTQPIIFNAGCNNTLATADLAVEAAKLGADGLLLVTPYYNKPTQSGLLAHFSYVAERVNLPICLYNVPSRTGVNLEPNTVAQLALTHKNIQFIKDATPDLSRVAKIKASIKEASTKSGAEEDTKEPTIRQGEVSKTSPNQAGQRPFIQLSGEDATTLAHLAAGGEGCISVVANVVPEHFQKIFDFWRQGALKEAQLLQQQLSTLMEAMFVESNPVPVKYALSLMGKCEPLVRLPLVELSPKSAHRVKKALSTVMKLCH